jgi:hypothetical protein
MDDSVFKKRAAAHANGFPLVQCDGKRPVEPSWQLKPVTAEELVTWGTRETGSLAKNTPGIDYDILDPDAVEALVNATRDWFDGRGTILQRVGRFPKCLIPLRTSQPFPKIQVVLRGPNGVRHKIEVLGDGQQYIIDGTHPETGEPYTWRDDLSPMTVRRDDLPEVDEAEVRQLVDYAIDLLITQFGFSVVHAAPSPEPRPNEIPTNHAPVDVEARFAAMEYQGADGSGINDTLKSTFGAMLRKGEHPNDVFRRAVDEVMMKAPPEWSRAKEETRVAKGVLSTLRFLQREHPGPDDGVPDWLHGEYHSTWLELRAAGKTPAFGRNHHGFFLRGLGGNVVEFPNGEGVTPPQQDDGPRIRFKLVGFSELRPGPEPLYLVDELIPVAGLVDVWGKAKCYKSFWTLDLMLHVALGWEYRDRSVHQCAVVYCAFEGAHGYKKRVEALRRHYGLCDDCHVPLYVMPGQANLIADHRALINDIKVQLGEVVPGAVVLDTLNKSLVGSENKDVDMAAYVRAAEAVRDPFHCVVIIVHHCGYDDTRPRGHSSLPGAVDAQLAVSRSEETITVTVEMMRDGPEETQVVSQTKVIEVGHDQNGKPLTSLVLVPSDAEPTARNDWPASLNVFYAALKHALNEHGEAFQPEAGALPVRAVTQSFVRKRFYDTYAEAEEDPKKRAANQKKAFGRTLKEAQSRGAIRTLANDGRAMIWKPEGTF